MKKEAIIKTLLFWNFWEKDINVGIPRPRYLDTIKRYLKTDEIIAITGVRRSGKSTILLQTLSHMIKAGTSAKNTLYVNFEDPLFFNDLKIDLIEQIYQTYVAYLKPEGTVTIVLDEVQKIQGWEQWARSKYDQKENVKIFVTGSNADFLSSEFSSVLTGRHLQIQINPLDFREFITFKKCPFSHDPLWAIKNKNTLAALLSDYLEWGGFPKVVLTDDTILRKELLMQYFHDILSKDIVERHKLKDYNKLKSLTLFYATNFTRAFSFHKVRNLSEVSLSLDSIQRFSQYLNSAYLIDFMPRFSYSIKNQMQTGRKVYLIDNGIQNAVAFKFSSDKGKLLENAVYQHVKAQSIDIYYFAEKKEVDFVCKQGKDITRIIGVSYDVSNKETFNREMNALSEGMKYFGLQQATLIIAEGEKQTYKTDCGTVTIIPFVEWSLGSQ